MNIRIAPITSAFLWLFLLAAVPSHAQPAARERGVIDAYFEAFGRAPDNAELKHWTGRSDWKDKAALVEQHRQWIRSNAKAQGEVVAFSYVHVFGRLPTEGERQFWLAQVKKGLTCNEVIASHREHIRKNAPAALKASAPLMATLKSKGLAVDAAGNITRSGRVVLPVGSYLIGQDGGSMVAAGAGNLLGNDGGSMVAAGGGNVLPSGAGGLVGNAGNTFKGRTLMSVEGKATPVEAGTVLLDRDGRGPLGGGK